MNDATTSNPASDAQANPTGIGFSIWPQGQIYENWVRLTTGVTQAAVDISREAAEFSRRRLEADVACWRSMMSCRNPGDFFDCQRRFCDQASTEYLAEGERLAAQMIDLARAAVPFLTAPRGT